MKNIGIFLGFVMIAFFSYSCSDCMKYLDKYEEEEKYFVYLNSTDEFEIGWRKKCTGFFFKEHPLEVLEENFPQIVANQDSIYLRVSYIFDIKNKNLHHLEVSDLSNICTIELLSDIEFIYFQKLRIRFFNTIFNPITKNVRGEPIPIKGQFFIQRLDGQLYIN